MTPAIENRPASHLALQRVMVRMLFDAAFARAVVDDPDRALAGVALTDEERAWLRRPDSRAWTADPHRAARSMDVLVQQYPAAIALAARSLGGPEPILAYFRSPRFHDAVQRRGSLALSFGDYLQSLVGADARTAPVAALEQAIARLHRSAGAFPPPTGDGPAWRLSPDKALHRAPGGTADLHEAIHNALAASRLDLAHAVFDAGVAIPDLTIDPAREEPLLLELARDDGPRVKYAVGAAEITAELYAFLERAATPRPFDDLVETIADLGAERDEAPEIVRGFIDEGLLVPVAQPAG